MIHPMQYDDYEEPAKKYRLLKDLPGVPAGTEAKENSVGQFWFHSKDGKDSYSFHPKTIAKYADFFEEVIDYKAEVIALGYEIQFYPSGYTESFVTAYKALKGNRHPAIKFYAKDLQELYQVVTENKK